MELDVIQKDIPLLVISSVFIICSLLNVQLFSLDLAWFAIILCDLPGETIPVDDTTGSVSGCRKGKNC